MKRILVLLGVISTASAMSGSATPESLTTATSQGSQIDFYVDLSSFSTCSPGTMSSSSSSSISISSGILEKPSILGRRASSSFTDDEEVKGIGKNGSAVTPLNLEEETLQDQVVVENNLLPKISSLESSMGLSQSLEESDDDLGGRTLINVTEYIFRSNKGRGYHVITDGMDFIAVNGILIPTAEE